MSKNLQNWTDQETERARQLLAQRADTDTFMRELGRTKGAAKSRMNTMKWKAKAMSRKDSRGDPNSRCVEAMPIPPEVIADAMRRANAPRSITALLCGDPPQGFSALDLRAKA